ncbi:hypothetical protein ARAM_007402 [Aspergillus rambellii]|uniref:Integral membrane protein n=1 Tax=Aspergillus rambellii TaxID=308745 RepID=A0A0F8V2H4_9EURO|nr:hypothetical protein ARAM_007402 [Aspergillus rambellii]
MDPIEPAGRSQDDLPQPQRPSFLVPPAQDTTSSHPRQRSSSLRSSRRPTIRLQRPPSFDQYTAQTQRRQIATNQSTNNLNPDVFRTSYVATTLPPAKEDDEAWEGNRRRSNSEPRPGRWSAPVPVALTQIQSGEPMHTLMEESPGQNPGGSRRPFSEQFRPAPSPVQPRDNRNILRRTSVAALSRLSRNRAITVTGTSPVPGMDGQEYDPHIVDVLDVIDPEVSALSTLTNVQNSLFIPNLGSFLNRSQTYTLSPPPELDSREETTTTDEGEGDELKVPEPRPALERPLTSISSVLEEGETRFAVLPEGITLDGWSQQDIEQLNDHVRHMLHSRRSKFKRAMKGFGKYVSKPLGFLVTLYATLITLFGLAWVLFLIGWINIGGRQLYVINVIDNVLVALFAIMGDGLAPFRAVDTYHMIFVAHYTFLTWKIRRKRRLPDLKDKNDLPLRSEVDADPEAGDISKEDEPEFSVLNPLQQQKLMHHQTKLAKSHTFYKPHETVTHRAFPLRMLVAIVVLLDCHSLFQIALGTCTWAISYHVRPFALTTVILCFSITCNISGGVLITLGDRRTRKKDVVERMFRQKLTKEAMKKIEKKKKKKKKQEDERLRGSQSDSTSTFPHVHDDGT